LVLYEVNLAVDAEIADAYAAWLGPHVAEIAALDGFLGAAWFEVEGGAEGGEADSRVRWCVQYRLRDRAALQRYFDGPAARFRADGLARFGGRFEATRRVLALREAVDGRR
jgi:hypothetical protein